MSSRRWLTSGKRLALKLLTGSGLPAIARRLSRDRTTVLVLHRFTEPGADIAGHDPARLRRDLEYLRREGYELLALEDAVWRHAKGDPTPRNTVCFTVDDGYEDFATLGAPAFSAYDCPVTVFLMTGFLDGETWPWWDQLEHVFRLTSHRRLELESADGLDVLEWDGEMERRDVVDRIVEYCKTIPDADKWRMIRHLSDRLEVALPDRPPPRYSPLTWDDVRRLARTGLFRFGAHTVTHPILSRTSREQTEWEILESRARIAAETEASSSIFCYPNGDPASFGSRELEILARSGFSSAVTTVHGYLSSGCFTAPWSAYSLPRYPYPGDGPRLVEVVSGLRRFRPRPRQTVPPSPLWESRTGSERALTR